MAATTTNIAQLPENTQDSFRALADLLRRLAGNRLVSLTAFGGWLVSDPLYEGAPARSVAVFAETDLNVLERLAAEGQRFGSAGLAAPLIMTPDYITASRDVFPLELLEIRHLHAVVVGEDAFAGLEFEAADVRLQCERELKSELIRLRQGLLAAAGERGPLAELCRGGAERATRVLRGLLHLNEVEVPQHSIELIAAAHEATDVRLDHLRQVVAKPEQSGNYERFAGLYDDLERLTVYVDAHVTK